MATRQVVRLWFLLPAVVVLGVVFASWEFYRRPAGSATGAGEVFGRLGVSKAATGGTKSRAKSLDEPPRPLSQSVIDGVEKFVFFVGYSRSGHSIIGSMMDAHPNMVVSHEYQLLPRCVSPERRLFPKNKSAIFNALYDNSYKEAMSGERSEKNTRKGYNLHVSTPWQGAFTRLRVIGDKGGMQVSKVFSSRYQTAKACLQAIMDIVKVPLIVFHVVRNPYDIIATEVLYHTTRQFDMRAEDLTAAKPEDRDVKQYADQTFKLATAVTRVMELTRVVEIHSEDFVADPRKTVRGICGTLSLPCPEEYVEACYEKAFKNSSKSRYNMEWSPDMLQYVANNMRNYSFFSRYTFDM